MNMRVSIVVLALALAGNAFAAGAEGLREARGPGLVPPDRLGQFWVLDARSQKALPNQKGGAAGCASATYMIDSEGNTMSVQTVHAQPGSDHGDALEKFLKRAHYDIADGAEGDSVHTYLTLVWDGGDASQHDALAQACAPTAP
jgi:hypothetical protein